MKNNSIFSGKATFWIVVILSLGTFFQLCWYGLITEQVYAQKDFVKDIDFRAFYTGGKIALDGNWHEVFDLGRQLEVQSQITGRAITLNQSLPFNHPPFLLPVQWLIASADYHTAYLLWGAFIALVNLFTGFLVFRLVLRLGWPKLAGVFLAIQVFLFYPLFVSLNKGQDSFFAILSLVILLKGLVENREITTGLGLAGLTLRPQLALPMALPFLFRQRRVWWWFTGFTLVLGLYSLLVVGVKGVLGFLQLLVITASGETILSHQKDMYNLKGLLIRLLPNLDINIISTLVWTAFLLALIGLSWLWLKSQLKELPYISVAVILSLFVSPHLHYHDLSFLLLPSLAISLMLTAKKVISPWQATLGLLFESIYLAIIHITPANYWGLYLLMLALVLLAWFAAKLPLTRENLE